VAASAIAHRDLETAARRDALCGAATSPAGRIFSRLAVSRRSAISDPSTWNTRGSPPGALKPAVTRAPGQKTQFHQPAGFVAGKVDAVENAGVAPAQIEERGRAAGRFVVATQLQHSSSMGESEIFVNRSASRASNSPAGGSTPASKCAKTKDTKMPAPFTVRKLRLRDLDRILEIECASFGEDAYDRNLFADHLPCPRGALSGRRAGPPGVRLF